MVSKYSARQLQIIEASIDLIGSGGIQNMTTKNLSNVVEISEPGIYRHFENKIEIVKATLDFLKGKMIERFQLIIDSKAAPNKKLKTLFQKQFEAFTARPEIVVVLLSEGLYQNEKELSAAIYDIMQASSKFFIKIIEEGQQKKIFRTDINCKELAFIVMGSMRLCIIQWHLSGFKFNLIKKGNSLCKSLEIILSNR